MDTLILNNADLYKPNTNYRVNTFRKDPRRRIPAVEIPYMPPDARMSFVGVKLSDGAIIHCKFYDEENDYWHFSASAYGIEISFTLGDADGWLVLEEV